LRFQSFVLHNREAIKSNVSQYSIFEQAREKGTKAINRETKRDSSRSDAIKTLILSQPTTDSTIVLKTGYRQTDRQTDKQTDRQTDEILIYRLTDSILSV
jgi:hypothetical protein